jgi:hypothetical protein
MHAKNDVFRKSEIGRNVCNVDMNCEYEEMEKAAIFSDLLTHLFLYYGMGFSCEGQYHFILVCFVASSNVW